MCETPTGYISVSKIGERDKTRAVRTQGKPSEDSGEPPRNSQEKHSISRTQKSTDLEILSKALLARSRGYSGYRHKRKETGRYF